MENKRIHPISVDKYKKVFSKYIGSDNFEIKEYFENGPILVKYDDVVFKVDNSIDISLYIDELLTNEYTTSIFMPSELWANVVEDVHLNDEYKKHVLKKLNQKELSDYKICSIHGDPVTFWNLAQKINLNLYGKLVVSVCEIFDYKVIHSYLMEDLIDEGEGYLNEIQDGIFEPYLTILDCFEIEDDLDDNDTFFIYTVDPEKWYIYENNNKLKI